MSIDSLIQDLVSDFSEQICQSAKTKQEQKFAQFLPQMITVEVIKKKLSPRVLIFLRSRLTYMVPGGRAYKEFLQEIKSKLPKDLLIAYLGPLKPWQRELLKRS